MPIGPVRDASGDCLGLTAVFDVQVGDVRSAPRRLLKSNQHGLRRAIEGQQQLWHVRARREPVVVGPNTVEHVDGLAFLGVSPLYLGVLNEFRGDSKIQNQSVR